MKIKNFEAFRWAELWEVVERREGSVYRTYFTGWHVPSTWKVEGDWLKVSHSTEKLQQAELEINPHPEFK